MASKQERLKKKRAATAERKEEAAFIKERDKAYEIYKDLYYSKIEKKRGSLLTKEQFSAQFAEDLNLLKNAGYSRKEALKENLGETIFELASQAFSKKEFEALTAAIDKARAEIKAGVFKGEGDATSWSLFMAETEDLDEQTLKENYTSAFGLLKSLFANEGEFEEWISPTVKPTDI